MAYTRRPMRRVCGDVSDGSILRVPVVVLDTETTGVNPSSDRIIELCALFCQNGEVVDFRKMRLDPQIQIPPEASQVHGIFNEQLVGKPVFADVAARLVDYISGKTLGRAAPWICGYNAIEFDGPLLNEELCRAGLSFRLAVDQIIDPMVFVRWHLRHLRSRSLSNVCEHLGVRLQCAHSALADARATWEVALELTRRGFMPTHPDRILVEQTRLRNILRDEWERFSYWLYRDRFDGCLRLGAGVHCGETLSAVQPDYIDALLRKIPDLPAEVRNTLQAARAAA